MLLNTNDSSWRTQAARLAMLGGVLGLLFVIYGLNGNTEEVEFRGRSAIVWMVRRWSGVAADLSQAWLVPLVSLYVLWRKRRDIAAAERAPSAWGLAVVCASLVACVLGMRVQQTRLVLLSLIGLLWGIPFYVCGREMAQRILFPCAYLLFCIPMSFLDSATFPLRLFASTAAAAVLRGVGIPVTRVGTVITAQVGGGGGFHMDVADPCSGLHYALAMLTLTAAYAYFSQRTVARQWLLFLCAAPLAVAGNTARIVAIGVVAAGFGEDMAMGLYHDYSGYVVFLVAVGLMIGLGSLINADWKERFRKWKQTHAAGARPRSANAAR